MNIYELFKDIQSRKNMSNIKASEVSRMIKEYRKLDGRYLHLIYKYNNLKRKGECINDKILSNMFYGFLFLSVIALTVILLTGCHDPHAHKMGRTKKPDMHKTYNYPKEIRDKFEKPRKNREIIMSDLVYEITN